MSTLYVCSDLFTGVSVVAIAESDIRHLYYLHLPPGKCHTLLQLLKAAGRILCIFKESWWKTPF